MLLLIFCAAFLCSFDSLPDKEYEKRICACSDNVFLPVVQFNYQDNTVKLNKRSPFGLTHSVYDFKKEEYFHISVWRQYGKSVFENVVIDQLNTLDYNGWTLTGAVNFYESDVDMRNVTFKNNRCEDALNSTRSEFTLINCTFDNIFADAFDSDFSNGILKNSLFRDIANDAIDFSGSRAIIEDCEIYNAGDKIIPGTFKKVADRFYIK